MKSFKSKPNAEKVKKREKTNGKRRNRGDKRKQWYMVVQEGYAKPCGCLPKDTVTRSAPRVCWTLL